MTNQEEWVSARYGDRDYAGIYEVSSMGRVRSLDRAVRTKGGATAIRKGIILKRTIHPSGYMVVGFTVGGRTKQCLVHRIVAFSFIGDPATPEMEACHNDGDRTNCELRNVRWDTKVGNAADKVAHGTNNRGSTNARATINEEGVDHVIELTKGGLTQGQIADEIGVKEGVVNHIITGRAWSHRTGIKFVKQHATISPFEVRQMRNLKSLGCTLEGIGEIFGVSKAAVFRNSKEVTVS